MGLRININISSLQAQTPMKKVARETEESFAKLSSGQRLTKAADDAASDTLSDSDRGKSSIEYQALTAELDRISLSTEFNGKKLLNGTGPRLDFQIGVGSHSPDDQISYQSSELNAGTQVLGLCHL